MDENRLLEQARQYVKLQLGNDASGHDWFHLERVARTARRIAELEGAEGFICELAALLHDVADEKLNDSEEAGKAKVIGWLEQAKVDPNTQARVMEIITTMSYKGGTNAPVTSLEARVVQDADRLDALGAMGIARTFVYAGWKGDLIHVPGQPPRTAMTLEQYRKERSTAVNHFYEKLLKLKDLMNTQSGRRMAESRHRYMEQFLEQFEREWTGQDLE